MKMPRPYVMAMILVLMLGAFGCSLVQKRQSSGLDDVYLMSFNVENLFDTTHDEGKDDYAFLPLSAKQTAFHKAFCAKIKVQSWKDECLLKDWTEEKLQAKMKRLAGAILQVKKGEGPDVIFLAEVENKAVLERLNREYLGSRYKEVVLIEGQDKRGIDVAILSKLPLNSPPKLHQIPFRFEGQSRAEQAKSLGDTRGILAAELKLPDGSLLMAYSLHLPNPMHPAALRTQALAFLKELSAPLAQTHYVVAAGDFNITAEENEKEQRTVEVAKDWLVAHAEGCGDCRGTYYYRPLKVWSFLDWMVFSKNLSGGGAWALDRSSIEVLTAYDGQVNAEGHPLSFEDRSGVMGVSDHLPLGAVLKRSR
jgi:endonuclease/exonuclease/phosphatase family metal-dependent hydrolase